MDMDHGLKTHRVDISPWIELGISLGFVYID